MGFIRKNISLSFAGLSLATLDVQSAVSEHGSSFSMVCTNGHAVAKVTQGYTCSQCSKTGTISAFPDRAVFTGDKAVLLTKEQLESFAATEEVKTSMTVNVHPASEVDTLLASGTVYYLSAPASQQGAYALIREAILSRPDLAFVAPWASRSKIALYRLGVRHDAITMTQLAWASDTNQAPQVESPVNKDQLKLLMTLIDGSEKPFAVEDYVDTAEAAKLEAIANGKEVAAVTSGAKSKPEPAKMIDLTEALKAAIEVKAKPRRAPARKAKVSA